MNEVQPAAKEGVSIEVKRQNEVLTQVLEESSWLLELDVEVPASTERTDWGLLTVALPADHANLRTVRTIGERAGYAEETRGQRHHLKQERTLETPLTSQVQALDTRVLPSCTALASRPKAEGREDRACLVHVQAFQRG